MLNSIKHFTGTVVHGEKVGRTLGYPTANIDIKKEALSLPPGVYAAWVIIEEKRYQGALVILDKPWKVEVHIIDMEPKDLYGLTIDIDVKERVSDILEFSSLDALKKKIEQDVEIIKELLL